MNMFLVNFLNVTLSMNLHDFIIDKELLDLAITNSIDELSDSFFGYIRIDVSYQDEPVFLLTKTHIIYYGVFKRIEDLFKKDNIIRDCIFYRYNFVQSIPVAGIIKFNSVNLHNILLFSVTNKSNLTPQLSV